MERGLLCDEHGQRENEGSDKKGFQTVQLYLSGTKGTTLHRLIMSKLYNAYPNSCSSISTLVLYSSKYLHLLHGVRNIVVSFYA